MTKYEKRTLTLRLLDAETKQPLPPEECRVEATIIGDLAIMVSPEDHAGWSVLHVPTMQWFDKARPASLARRCSVRRLREWCELVQSDQVADWEVVRALGVQPDDAAKAQCREARERLLAHCREQEPE